MPAAFAVALMPTFVKGSLAGKNFDPAHPRAVSAAVEKDTTMDKKVSIPELAGPITSPPAPVCIHDSRSKLLNHHQLTRDRQIVRRIQRADAASANNFETLGFYAGGVAAALAAGVAPGLLNGLCAGYIGARVAYNVVYVFLQDNRKLAPVRSAIWMVCMGITSTLWVMAGNKAVA